MNIRVFIGTTAVLCGVVIATGVFGATVVRAFVIAPPREPEMTVPLPLHKPLSATMMHAAATPVRIRIPAIGVDAPIEEVGIGISGNMAVPRKFAAAGWLRYGPVPGEEGTAVIDGHVDNAGGFPGVFKRLGELSPGDRIYIVLSDDTEQSFTVRRVEIYAYDMAPSEEIFDAARPGSYLNLITCDGMWVQRVHSYDRRLVVYTELVEE